MAGGASRRFGGLPKGLARIGGARIADRALRALRAATDRQVVIANDRRAPGWFPGEQTIPDDEPGLGPLNGLRTALRAAAGEGLLVVAWDMPFVTPDLLAELRRIGEADAIAVAPRLSETMPAEPLCAYYPPAALPACERLLGGGARRAAALLEALAGARTLTGPALAAFGDPARLLRSVDSPDALAELGGEPPDPHAAPGRR